MSRLWSSILSFIIIIGNNSGCHQLPERSFFYKGKQFPVCARCTGVFIGQVSALLFMLLISIIPPAISLTFLFIMGLDWFIQYIGFLKSNNIRRFVTGILGGFGLFNLYGTLFLIIRTYIRTMVRCSYGS